LHLGHAFAALFAHDAARRAGGRFLLRFEDIDQTRARPAFVESIKADLAWLGLTWERPVRHQSRHFDDYRAALDALTVQGLIYPCFCTRADIAQSAAAAHGPDGPIYPGLCRRLPPAEAARRQQSGEPFALRLRMREAMAASGLLTWEDETAGIVVANPGPFGDVVLARRDTPTSYHLAVTVDDAIQGVTLVTRGSDLFESTHIHRLLQALLNLPVPRWHHHRLLVDEQGRRLAKRDQARSLHQLREDGATPEDIRRMVGI
jgi:glutamyl-Q tRNA(Asp) synthetase